MIELAHKKKWMFARGTLPPPLMLFEELGGWRNATPVLGALNRSFPADFQVSDKFRAGFHVSNEIPAIDVADNQRLVFLKYYGPNFGLQYVGAMYVGILQDIPKGVQGIAAAMQARFNIPLPDSVEYFRLLGPTTSEFIDITATEEGKTTVPEHGEIIVIQATGLDPELSFPVKLYTFSRFSVPDPVPRVPTFGETLFEDAMNGFLGVDVKFTGGPDDNKYAVKAHRSALCTTDYFRRLFTTGAKEGQHPPILENGFYEVITPGFCNEATMKHFIKWIYTRRVDKELKLDVPLCLNLSTYLFSIFC